MSKASSTLPLLFFLLCLMLSGCATFEQRGDAIYIGNPDDAQYDPMPESDQLKDCMAHQKPGGVCVEGVDIKAERFEPVVVVGEKGGRYRFRVSEGWHGGRYGWVEKSDIAYPEDFKPVTDWTAQSRWDLCDRYGCMIFDIASTGYFKASYTDNCSIKNLQGKCTEHCIFNGTYNSPQCFDSGQVMTYAGVYQLRGKAEIPTYLIPVAGKGLCWSDAWIFDHTCTKRD